MLWQTLPFKRIYIFMCGWFLICLIYKNLHLLKIQKIKLCHTKCHEAQIIEIYVVCLLTYCKDPFCCIAAKQISSVWFITYFKALPFCCKQKIFVKNA